MSVVTDKFAEIEKLDEMRRGGFLSEKDYELQKTVLLKQVGKCETETYVIPTYSCWEAIQRFWGNSLDWKGRATRAEYWWGGLGTLPVIVIMMLLFGDTDFTFTMVSVILFIPVTTLIIRRIHDTGRSAKFLWAPIIAALISVIMSFSLSSAIIARIFEGIVNLVVDIMVLVFAFMPSQPHKNKYDPEFE